MILTPGIVARLMALGLVSALLQVTFFADVRFFDVAPDVVSVVVLSLGLLAGSLAGATAGFAIGLAVDVLLLQTLGATSLALLSVGYLAGRYRESFGRATRGATVLLAGALTLLGTIAFAGIQIALGVEAVVSPSIIGDAIVKALFAMAVAIPIYSAVRRLLRPALIDEQGRPSRAATARPNPLTAD